MTETRPAMKSFELATEEGIVVLLPEGDITARTYPEIESRISEKLQCGVTVVVAVMDRVDSIDIAGLGFLFRLKRMIEMKNGNFFILNPSYYVEKTLKSAGGAGLMCISTDESVSSINIHDNSSDVRYLPVNLG
jgi:anti-anti-sigma factor